MDRYSVSLEKNLKGDYLKVTDLINDLNQEMDNIEEFIHSDILKNVTREQWRTRMYAIEWLLKSIIANS